MANYREDTVNNIMDAFDMAKEAIGFLPPLPPGIKPVHIRVLTAMQRILAQAGQARVSDINDALGYQLPNTTRFINELVALKLVKKSSTSADRRVVWVRTTPLGEQYVQRYILGYHDRLETAFSNIRSSDCLTMIKTIRRIHQAVHQVCQNY